MTEQLEQVRHFFQALDKPSKAEFLLKLSIESYLQVRFFSDIMLRDCQIVQEGRWRYWLFIGGRGTGKTACGAAELRKRVYKGQKGLCVLAPTHQDLVKVVIPAIIKEFPDHQRPIYIGGDKQILKCHNGIVIDCRTSQQGECRGPNYTFIWIDELVKCWSGLPDKIHEMFQILNASVRKGGAQILITTTGAPWKIFRDFYEMAEEAKDSMRPLIHIRTGKMSDNEYLSPQAVEALYKQYGNSRYADQELQGIINFDIDGALWNPALIESTRKTSIEEIANPLNANNIKRYANPFDFFLKFVIGTDPALTANSNSDKWGIIVAALGRDMHLYVIEDKSKIYSPNDAANVIADLHRKYRNASIIAESNAAGDLVKYVIRTKLPTVEIKMVHAHQNKMTRAQPIVVLWDQGRGHLVGKLDELEKEMIEYTGDPGQKSPNSLDAMVHACQYLLLEPNFRMPQTTWMPNFR